MKEKMKKQLEAMRKRMKKAKVEPPPTGDVEPQEYTYGK